MTDKGAVKKDCHFKKRAAGKAFFTGGRATHSKRTDHKKGNDSRFNDNSSADFHKKQGTKTQL